MLILDLEAKEVLKVLKLQLKEALEVLKVLNLKVIKRLGSLKSVKPNGMEVWKVLVVCLRSGRVLGNRQAKGQLNLKR